MALLRALRAMIRADSHPLRRKLFETLQRARADLRVVTRIHSALGGSWCSTLLVCGFGLKTYLAITPPPRAVMGRVLAVAGFSNARRAVRRATPWFPAEPLHVGMRLTSLGVLGGLIAFAGLVMHASRLHGAWRVVRRVNRRHDFLVSCRVAATLAAYARARVMLRELRPSAVLVSSASNPEEAGFLAAARRAGVPTVFVSHAYPNAISPPLDFSVSILEGEAAIQAHDGKGAIRGHVALAGLEGPSLPLDPGRFERERPVIGIFPPKVVAWPVFTSLLADCRRVFRARRVLIRWHPDMIGRERMASRLGVTPDIEQTPSSGALSEVALRCDWAIASLESNVHLGLLKLGVPCLAVSGLRASDEGEEDLYGFERNGVLPPRVASLDQVSVSDVMRFYGAGWADRFRRYDAAYLRPAETIDDLVRTAVAGAVGAAPLHPAGTAAA
jgi:hypothetical protein